MKESIALALSLLLLMVSNVFADMVPLIEPSSALGKVKNDLKIWETNILSKVQFGNATLSPILSTLFVGSSGVITPFTEFEVDGQSVFGGRVTINGLAVVPTNKSSRVFASVAASGSVTNQFRLSNLGFNNYLFIESASVVTVDVGSVNTYPVLPGVGAFELTIQNTGVTNIFITTNAIGGSNLGVYLPSNSIALGFYDNITLLGNEIKGTWTMKSFVDNKDHQ